MKTVFLTGATGFVGSQCIEPLLARGYKIYAISSKQAFKSIPGVEWIHLDLKNEKETKVLIDRLKPTHLLHLAWYAEPPYFWQSHENILWLQASLHLVEVFIKNGGRRMVIAGTCAEYEWGHSTKCHETQTPCKPTSLYGIAKYSLFLLSQKLAEMSDISFAWGRLFHFYGQGEHPQKVIRSVISSLLKGASVPFSTGEQVRDYLHVKDVSSALVALLDSACRGAVNIGSGQSVEMREILNQISKTLGAEGRIEFGSTQPRSFDPALLVPCTDRLFKEVGWKPAIDLTHGLNQTIDWLKTI